MIDGGLFDQQVNNPNSQGSTYKTAILACRSFSDLHLASSLFLDSLMLC